MTQLLLSYDFGFKVKSPSLHRCVYCEMNFKDLQRTDTCPLCGKETLIDVLKSKKQRRGYQSWKHEKQLRLEKFGG